MANTFTLTSGSYQGRYLQVSCVQTIDIANNRSKIDWTLSSIGGSSTWYSTGATTLTINGQQVYYKARVNWDAKVFPAAKGSVSGTIYVNHNNGGDQGITVKLTTAIYDGESSSSKYSREDYWQLDNIPRQAALTSAPDFTDLDNPMITYSNPAGNAVDSLMACISFTGAKDDIAYRSIPKTGTNSYTFNLTDAERDLLRNNTTSGKRDVTFYVRTIIAGKYFYSTAPKKLTIVETDKTRPSIAMDITLNNGSLSIIFANMYIQGKSRLDINLTAEGKYGADITNYSVSVDGKTYYTSSFTTDVITKSGDVDIIASVKDTRGFTGTATHTIENVLAYSKPLVVPIKGENAILCYRSDGNGLRVGNSTSVWVKAKRSYYNLLGKNQCILQWRRRLISETTWDAWKALIKNTDTTDEYNGLIIDEVFELDKSYAVQIRVVDEIGEDDIKEFEIPTQDVALHLGAGGKNVAVGTYCDYSEPYTFYSAWKAIFDEGVLGTLLNYNVADVLEFSVECAPGITPIIITDETNKESLPIGNYAYSVGIVHKGTADRCNVILFDYMSGKIAINVHLSDGWTGWKYITPQ